MFFTHLPPIVILLIGMLGSIWLRKLTVVGALVGGVIGFLLYWGAGYTGLILMALFFVLGTIATTWYRSEKVNKRLSSQSDSRRTAAQVLANAGTAGLLALLSILHPEGATLYLLAIATVFSSATADTLSSELGNVYGKRFYHVLTLKSDTKGLDGVISLEGTIAGILGSVIIATVYSLCEGFHTLHFIVLIVAGTLGNFMDSLLGATLERKGILGNNAVNFLNTLFAALVAVLLYFISKG